MTNPSEANRSYEAAIAWLYGRINYEATTAIPYGEQAMKLDRARELARRADDPQERLRIVHIAGTKGKGSTGAMIAGGLTAAGVSTGVYSSPHFDRIEERFAIDGEPCSPEEFVALIEFIRPLAEAMDQCSEGERGPTFFDITTVMALRHFADRGVSAAVMEVGLGGRLDSTNIVAPEVAVITSISRDHTKQLGDTLEAIAAEKAGIIKPRVPVVSGVTEPGPAGVIERIATERKAPLHRLDRDFSRHQISSPPHAAAWGFTRSIKHGSEERIEPLAPAMPGPQQAQNAAVALAVLGLLADRGWPLEPEQRLAGVNRARLPGRMERLEGAPLVVIDGAHNDASAAALADALDSLCDPAPPEKRVLVVAISSNKDALAILAPLVDRFASVVATRFLDNPRAFEPADLAERVREASLKGSDCHTAEDPAGAFTTAERLAGEGGAVVFSGSLLFAAEARRLFRDRLAR